METTSLILNIICLLLVISLFVTFAFVALKSNLFKHNNENGMSNKLINELKESLSNSLFKTINEAKNEISDEKIALIKSNSEYLQKITKEASEKELALNNKINNYQNEINEKLNRTLNDIKIFREKIDNDNKTLFDKLVYENNKKIVNEFLNLNRHIETKINEGLGNIKKGVDDYFNEKLTNQINENFKSVGEKIQKLDDDMIKLETLQNSVGNLNKIMTGVKTKGNFGEFHLENILRDHLSDHFYKQYKISKNDIVDFAIKVPNGDSELLLVIDSKFPTESFSKYSEATSKEEQETYLKDFYKTIQEMAKSISNKYIVKDVTLDNAIMYIPSESIYNLIISNDDLIFQISDKYNVTIVGPSTIMTIINYSKIAHARNFIFKNINLIRETIEDIKKSHESIIKKLDSADKNTDSVKKAIGLIRNETNSVYAKLSNTKLDKSLEKIADVEELENKEIVDIDNLN
ncbi:DNA recombination protein RmuC [Mycoplasmopsis edwardii]|uniref:DNA recombination protein RmuC n=1 Tax=Mycoplasmopsis edwardii TaxID=53558 RepID=A0ACD4PJ16_9BACT|nr:DNA recombination protein RmuC [Mycoplasmopsis edwardii]WBP84310.1 DNA recombination protein RmuC [Mycoplasmopsis edwardii]